MNEKTKKRMKKNIGSQHGFTLLEILVVLTIMGFLVAMVAPRLAMVGTDAVDTVCDTNQNRSVTYLATYFQKSNGSLPDGLTNLVTSDGSNSTVYAPSISDGDPDDGIKGVFSQEFGLRNNLVAHHLNAAEVAELAGLGIENVFDLNDPEDARTDAPFMNEKPLADGDVVAMVGMGASATGATDYITRVSTNQVEEDALGTDVVEYGWGEPEKLGRIVLGLGPESGLVKGRHRLQRGPLPGRAPERGQLLLQRLHSRGAAACCQRRPAIHFPFRHRWKNNHRFRLHGRRSGEKQRRYLQREQQHRQSHETHRETDGPGSLGIPDPVPRRPRLSRVHGPLGHRPERRWKHRRRFGGQLTFLPRRQGMSLPPFPWNTGIRALSGRGCRALNLTVS